MTVKYDGRRMTSVDDIRHFALAGNAILTLVGKRERFTYRVRMSEDGKMHFVSVLTGADNESSYSYLGIVGKLGDFRRTAKSRITEEATSHKAFAWFWGYVRSRRPLPDSIEVWHEGRCGRCARRLTVPESIERGIGPECAGKVAMICEAA